MRNGNLGKFFYPGKIITNNFTRVMHDRYNCGLFQNRKFRAFQQFWFIDYLLLNIACPQYVPGYLFFQWDNFCWRIPNVYLFIIYKVCLLFHEEGPRQVEDRRPSYLSFEGQKWCTCACLRNDPLLRPVRIAQFPIERVVWQTTQMTFGHGWSRKSPPWKKYEKAEHNNFSHRN